MRIHLDTDLGSDTDDACALAMLLGWPDVEITGITTSIDPGGIRAGFVTRCLELAGRTDNNRWVNFDGPADEPMSLINRFADVEITEAMPNSLRGRLVAATFS